MFHSEFFGCVIWRNIEPGRLRWTCNAKGERFAADTLAGIRELVRNAMN